MKRQGHGQRGIERPRPLAVEVHRVREHQGGIGLETRHQARNGTVGLACDPGVDPGYRTRVREVESLHLRVEPVLEHRGERREEVQAPVRERCVRDVQLHARVLAGGGEHRREPTRQGVRGSTTVRLRGFTLHIADAFTGTLRVSRVNGDAHRVVDVVRVVRAGRSCALEGFGASRNLSVGTALAPAPQHLPDRPAHGLDRALRQHREHRTYAERRHERVGATFAGHRREQLDPEPPRAGVRIGIESGCGTWTGGARRGRAIGLVVRLTLRLHTRCFRPGGCPEATSDREPGSGNDPANRNRSQPPAARSPPPILTPAGSRARRNDEVGGTVADGVIPACAEVQRLSRTWRRRGG